ncbi:MAG: glutamate--tRNA ligase [Patescibacteria group bacterium]|nr:glutamate--tRNA ligase [Patescibacteria group bacterium]MDD5121545.1 glutamate--tRNA ligase [Patescibacteria group bacterium]MDD5396291.1 glutamate--tRNA ligase [Patescibacteria group bacterium]
MVRVRFAPSPTGYLHVGSLRTFLFNWLFARHYKGKMLLRIEDTDQKRYVSGAVESLIKTLQDFGLDWDEGPYLDKKEQIKEMGKVGPYFQTQRLDIYKNFAQKLIDEGNAYYCFCTEQELDKMREKQTAKKLPPMYDERCRRLNKEEVALRLRSGQPYVIRLKIPEQGIVKIKDLIRNDIEFNYRDVDDAVIIKSDGFPTYHLANVIDDHLMNITHVLRAEEWISSVPKHVFIYQSFGWDLPRFGHVPLLLNPDRSKLSKRQGDVAAEDYLAKGYLPEAFLNFLALLGWNPGDNREIFSLKELIKEFSIEKVQKAGAIFNLEKLDWMNGCYIRKKNTEELTRLCLPYLINADFIRQDGSQIFIKSSGIKIDIKWLSKIIKLEQERLKVLNDIPEKTKFFFIKELNYDPQILIWKKSDVATTKSNLELIKNNLNKLSSNNFKAQNVQNILNCLGKDRGVGDIFWPFRVALTGEKSSPPPAEIAEVLGFSEAIRRIDLALDKLNLMS